MKYLYISLTVIAALFLITCSQTVVKKRSPIAGNDKQKESLKNRPDKAAINTYCRMIQKSFDRYRWGKSDCQKHNWLAIRNSVKGTPLIWKLYGKEQDVASKETTILMCGVHGDEITPIKFCFDAINYLDSLNIPDDRLVIVAPIVNPDSFFKKRPTRINANGIDVNRNFPTKDFHQHAIKTWKHRYGSDKRRYPGITPMSEPETVFQVNLIKRYKPDKIISVHAPLNMLDYDGPIDQASGGAVGPRANQLLIQMSQKAKGYRIKNYPFFTGSLGNYAGNERSIPTYTLELPDSDYTKHKKYWKLFKPAIRSAVFHQVQRNAGLNNQKNL